MDALLVEAIRTLVLIAVLAWAFLQYSPVPEDVADHRVLDFLVDTLLFSLLCLSVGCFIVVLIEIHKRS